MVCGFAVMSHEGSWCESLSWCFVTDFVIGGIRFG